MKHSYLFIIAFLALLFPSKISAQCAPGQTEIKVVLLTDNYPQETSWNITNSAGTIIMSNRVGMASATLYQDSICVPANTCYRFNISDNASDGICCNYGHGWFKVYVNDTFKTTDSSFGATAHYEVQCPPGQSCNSSTSVGIGNHTAPGPENWFNFTPSITGMYGISTCNQGNTCNTKLYIYDYCTNLHYDTTNLSTIYYANDNCGTNSENINAYMQAGHQYYIRIGQSGTSCTGSSIFWSIGQPIQTSGCMDIAACNYDPFATISTPSTCIYYPSPLCTTGPDLQVDGPTLTSGIYMSTTMSSDACAIREGCINGYNSRELINFSTKINNIGTVDFYAGMPPANTSTVSPIFEFDACHTHWHYKDYAEYILTDQQNNVIPIGYKNGFCVMDLGCTTGIAKFGCNNMGITAGCSDTYHSGLPCQWIDVTDVADGTYKLVVRANWRPRPDFYGRYETSYTNNWASACITIGHNTQGVRTVTVLPNCQPYTDCAGTVNGLAEKDCAGNCNGIKIKGDVNNDTARTAADVAAYMSASLLYNLPVMACTDLNGDGKINVLDAALLHDCVIHGPSSGTPSHAHRSCKFPNRVKNPNQHASFSIGNINYLTKEVSVYITNPDAQLMGYQFYIRGLELSGTQNMMGGFAANLQYRPSGQVIALTSNETTVPKNSGKALLMKLKYNTILTNTICIDSAIAMNNEQEEVVAGVTDSICLASIPTPPPPNGIGTISGNGVTHHLYPNPMQHSATLEIANAKRAAWEAQITDISGRIVRTYDKNTGEILEIQKGTLAPGVYFLNVTGPVWNFTEKLMIE